MLLRPCTAPCRKGTKTCSRRANAHLLGRHPHAVCQCLPAWLSSTCPAKTAREPKQLMNSIQPWHMWQGRDAGPHTTRPLLHPFASLDGIAQPTGQCTSVCEGGADAGMQAVHRRDRDGSRQAPATAGHQGPRCPSEPQQQHPGHHTHTDMAGCQAQCEGRQQHSGAARGSMSTGHTATAGRQGASSVSLWFHSGSLTTNNMGARGRQGREGATMVPPPDNMPLMQPDAKTAPAPAPTPKHTNTPGPPPRAPAHPKPALAQTVAGCPAAAPATPQTPIAPPTLAGCSWSNIPQLTAEPGALNHGCIRRGLAPGSCPAMSVPVHVPGVAGGCCCSWLNNTTLTHMVHTWHSSGTRWAPQLLLAQLQLAAPASRCKSVLRRGALGI